MNGLSKNDFLLEYNELLEEAMKYKQDKREKTVFSIGGRGHYENPISDVIAFFIDPREEHKFETLMLASFLKLLNNSNINIHGGSVEAVEREAVTPKGNRIDLVVVGEEWVLVIENKIYHDLLNPLDDYESYIKAKYPDKEAYYTILSINEIYGVPNPWKNILYQDLQAEVKNNAGPYMFNSTNAKWSFFLNDFLLNIEELIGEYKVDNEMIEFVQKNYSKILNLVEVKDKYITTIKKNFSTMINGVSSTRVIEKIHNWDKRVAIRFYCPDTWGKQTNQVLVILPNGKYKVYYYVYGIGEPKQETENNKLLKKGYHHWKEGKNSILCYKTVNSYNLDEVKEEFKLMVQHLNDYYKRKLQIQLNNQNKY